MSGRPGSRVITLRAGTVDSETLAITVRDSGPGIPPDDMARLFDPFFTTKDGGMGMGLAICRRTLEAHGGRLSVVSTPGSGATFHLTLPYSQEHASP
ncbi:sensor histidine kinase [Bradyrhizobium sp. YCK136]